MSDYKNNSRDINLENIALDRQAYQDYLYGKQNTEISKRQRKIRDKLRLRKRREMRERIQDKQRIELEKERLRRKNNYLGKYDYNHKKKIDRSIDDLIKKQVEEMKKEKEKKHISKRDDDERETIVI